MASDRDVAARMELAQAFGTARATRGLGAHFGDPAYGSLEIEGGWLIFAPPHVPLSGAKGFGFGAAVSDAVIERVEAESFLRTLPAQFDLCDLGDPELGARLSARGYASSCSCEAWVRDGSPVDDVAAPEGVRIIPVDPTDAATVEAFAYTVASGYHEGGEPDEWNLVIGRNAATRPTRFAFLAEVDGQRAGGGLLGLNDGLASFTFMSTLPAHRRRGVQGALMRARLARATAAGADLVCVQCEVGSPTARNAARLGFRHAYTRTFWTLPLPE